MILTDIASCCWRQGKPRAKSKSLDTLPKKGTTQTSEIERLYAVECWPVIKIAGHLGVTRQAVYERMRNAGIALDRRRRKRLPDVEISARKLRRLFEVEKRSIAQVARHLGTTPWKVRSAMLKYKIASRASGMRPKKYPQVAMLKIGDSFEAPLPVGNLASLNCIRADAKRHGFRVVMRRVGGSTVSITRTPPLTPEAVASMRRSGMTKTAIAKIYLADRKTISRMLREMGVS